MTAAPNLSRTPNSNSALDLQPSLKIGQPGDKYEQEADATADKVMRMTDELVSPSRARVPTQEPSIQRFSLSGAWNWAKGKVNQGVNWAKSTLGKVGDWAMDKLAAMLENVPGWHLFTVFLGKNPITGEAVPRTDRNLVEGMVKLAPMGNLTFQALDARGGITASPNGSPTTAPNTSSTIRTSLPPATMPIKTPRPSCPHFGP